ncbi:MAG: MBL fold metallo-hydrolase [Chloroflexi bacterium]|nr:MBL fold metallo-hydrolase [Chloroflexota bacterium]
MEKLRVLDSLRITVLAEDSVLYESSYLGQHGLSLLLEGVSGGNIKRILVDVGQNSEALLSNMETLGISPTNIDTIVLTHCHYDHTQGIVRMLREIGRKDVQVIAHPSIFRLHFVTQPYARHVGIMPGDSKVEIEKAGGSLSLTKDPLMIMPGIMTTGEVKRRTEFEEARIGLKTIENGMVVDDLMLDDISVIANVKDKGLVIITGCSHAGIINITNQSIEVAGGNKIEGIIGGLHLVEASDTVIKRTVEELTKLNVAWISAGHCTGFKAQVELYLAFKERFLPLHTGMQFELGPTNR